MRDVVEIVYGKLHCLQHICNFDKLRSAVPYDANPASFISLKSILEDKNSLLEVTVKHLVNTIQTIYISKPSKCGECLEHFSFIFILTHCKYYLLQNIIFFHNYRYSIVFLINSMFVKNACLHATQLFHLSYCC